MSNSLTLVVLIAGAPPDAAFASAIDRGAVETLGAGTQVVFREADAVPPDAEAEAMESREHADAIAVVSWADARRSHAELRVHLAHPPHWVRRDLGFAASDAVAEEGRAVGFAVASMIPEATEAASPPPPVIERARPVDETTRARRPYGSVRLAAVAAISLGGEGGGLGGTVDGRYFTGEHFALRAAASLRLGDVDAADARQREVKLAGGLAWRSGDGSRAHPFAAGARVDALAVALEVTRTHDGMNHDEGRWLPGAEALLEGSFAPSSFASVFVAGGVECLFGRTDVDVRGQTLATVAPVSLLFEAGLEARF
jgi:hypothetical protein